MRFPGTAVRPPARRLPLLRRLALRLLLTCMPGVLGACATTSSSGPLTGAPLTSLAIVFDAPPAYTGPKAQNYSYSGAPQLPPELDASIRFTLPSLLATHGVQIVPDAPGVPVLEVYFTKLYRVCTNGMACSNSTQVMAQLGVTDGQVLWSHQAWVDDDAYEPAGQKEMLRRLVADMSHDHVIPAAVRVPERSLVVVTEAADPAIEVRSYAVRFSRSGMGADFKLSSERTLRESLGARPDWHSGKLLAEGAAKAAAATHATVKSLSPYPAGLIPGCDDAAQGHPARANADVTALLRRLAAENQASYGLFLSSSPLPAEDQESPLNKAGLFIAYSTDDSGLMTFNSTPRGAAHREGNLVTPYCTVFYDATTGAALFQAWRPTRPVHIPAKYYEQLGGIGEDFVPSLAGEFDSNLGESLGRTLPELIEQMTP